MDRFIPGIQSILRRATGTGLFVILTLIFICAEITCASAPADRKFTVFKADFDITPLRNSDEKLVKDFYINGGEQDGIETSTVFDVYREKMVRDAFLGKETIISVLIGQIKVIEVFEHVAITRIINLVYSEKTPVLQYRSVMIGDYAVPQHKKLAAPISRTLPELPGIPMPPPVRTPEKAPKLYSMIPVTAGSGDLSAPGVSFPSQVLFEFDDSRLKPEALLAITEVVNMFNKSRDRKIIIEGHTCSLGEHGYNISLSKKRASSVSEYLTNVMGIPAENIRIEYYGELFPVSSNSDESGREKNRRVDIRFLPLSKKERLLQSLVKK